MATIEREPANRFNFLRFRKVNDALTNELIVNVPASINLDDLTPTIYPYYFGSGAENDPANIDPVVDGTTVNANASGEVTVNWTGTGAYLWVWFDDTVAEKTHWSDPANPLNQGTIGEPSDLFLAPVVKSAGGRSGLIYVTELLTTGRPLIIS